MRSHRYDGFFAFLTDDERPDPPPPAAHFMNPLGAAFLGRGRDPETLGAAVMISTGAAPGGGPIGMGGGGGGRGSGITTGMGGGGGITM